MESAKSVLDRLRKVTVTPLYNPEDRFYSYKLVSLYKALDEITLPGDWAQFGVYRGRCARFMSNFLIGKRQFHLFDSFEGLPEDWMGAWKAGSFALKESQIPVFHNPNIHTHKGWFSDTVAPFATTLEAPLAFLHIDCDLYSSTMDVLNGLNMHIADGTILLFDEYMMESKGELSEDEHRALHEWAESFGRTFEFLWRTEWMQVCVRVTNNP